MDDSCYLGKPSLAFNTGGPDGCLTDCCVHSTDQKPKLSQLHKLHTLVPGAGLVWYDIGVSLQLGDEDDGEYLEKLGQEESTKKLFKVLQKWLQECGNQHILKPVTWRKLLEVLESQSLNVENLKDKLSKGRIYSIAEKIIY